MLKVFGLSFILLINTAAYSQMADRKMMAAKDSALNAAYHKDSLKIESEFAEKLRWDNIKNSATYPLVNAGEYSGVVPVKNITEVPDPNMEYKLLFELTAVNPDSVAKDINFGLGEACRILNLHVASGIPVKNLTPVIVVHASALKAFTTNAYYREHYKIDNPNLDVINTLGKAGVKFIACGQALTFFNIKPEELLKNMRVSLTAQTVLSSYQQKGYVWYDLGDMK